MKVSDVITRLKITEYVTSTNPNPAILRDIDMNDDPIGGGGDTSLTSGSGVNSVVLDGYNNDASGEASMAVGVGVNATNKGEFAQGQYNISNPDTIASIGVGTSNSNRSNAIEVSSTGAIYIKGVNGYDGTNPDPGINDLKTTLDDKESISNKVQTIDAGSTEVQYPSAKCVYNLMYNYASVDTEEENLKLTI